MNEQFALCTVLLMVATSLVSYLGFHDRRLESRYIFNPESILAGKEYHRLVTSAFLHANWSHLVLNLVSLYLFGKTVELYLGRENFMLVYFGAVVGGNLLSLFVHRHHQYQAYGASGGVCGIIFAYILMFPSSHIYPLPIDWGIPGWLYAPAFILASFYGMKNAVGNIGHDAHLGGAIVGLLITAALQPRTVRSNPMVFLVVLIAAVLLLAYLWLNPLFLPGRPVHSSRPSRWRKAATRFARKRKPLEVDQVLEKINKSGLESLSAEERALLTELSGKYRRRAESKKPDSGLAI